MFPTGKLSGVDLFGKYSILSVVYSLLAVRYEANPQLGEWVKEQRACYKGGTFKLERKEKLEKIGFVWDMQGETDQFLAIQKRQRTEVATLSHNPE